VALAGPGVALDRRLIIPPPPTRVPRQALLLLVFPDAEAAGTHARLLAERGRFL
jgi:hypothetical protein